MGGWVTASSFCNFSVTHKQKVLWLHSFVMWLLESLPEAHSNVCLFVPPVTLRSVFNS